MQARYQRGGWELEGATSSLWSSLRVPFGHTVRTGSNSCAESSACINGRAEFVLQRQSQDCPQLHAPCRSPRPCCVRLPVRSTAHELPAIPLSCCTYQRCVHSLVPLPPHIQGRETLSLHLSRLAGRPCASWQARRGSGIPTLT